MLVAARPPASAARCRGGGVGGAGAGAPPMGLAVTCACVVRHCASALAPPMGADSIGRIAPDQLGLNLPDRV